MGVKKNSASESNFSASGTNLRFLLLIRNLLLVGVGD